MVICQNCRTEAADGTTYCGTCGAPLQGQSYQAGFQQYPQQYPGTGQPYAQGYGLVPVAPPKSKTAAILLAVFLSFWTWLYTYQRDASKFWLGLGLAVGGFFLGMLLSFLIVPIIFLFAPFGVWVWAIVDTASKPDQYYLRYPAG
ncbi:MAG: zinc ribbon domain-containing protein [Actinobacteria bacterium]|nr:zinc ribbon domain-containing protein [Actinomycetota bacterium]MCL5447411.1 zinc ribbon domain-containing protein [Actinomycetota bacterium]